MTGQQNNEAVAQDGTDLNKLIRYTMWSVFRVDGLEGVDRGAAAEELQSLFDKAAEQGVTTRGSYDVQGFRADADNAPAPYLNMPPTARKEAFAQMPSAGPPRPFFAISNR